MPWPLHLAVHVHPKQTLSDLELRWGMTAPDGVVGPQVMSTGRLGLTAGVRRGAACRASSTYSKVCPTLSRVGIELGCPVDGHLEK